MSAEEDAALRRFCAPFQLAQVGEWLVVNLPERSLRVVVLTIEERASGPAVEGWVERVNPVEAALGELLRRAEDPTLPEGAMGAWIMLGNACKRAREALDAGD